MSLKGRPISRGRWPSRRQTVIDLTAGLPHLRTRNQGPLAQGCRTGDSQWLNQGSLLLPGIHTQKTLGRRLGLLPPPQVAVQPGPESSKPSVLLGYGCDPLPPAASGGASGPWPRHDHGLCVTSSFFLYELSTCHPAVCFSLLRFSSNYVDFLHPTPSWKLIRLNIFIYYHFAQLLPAFPITLPASL